MEPALEYSEIALTHRPARLFSICRTSKDDPSFSMGRGWPFKWNPRLFVTLLLPVMLVRVGSNFFHTHSIESNGYSVSVSCNACELEVTVALETPDPAPLPSVFAFPLPQISPSEEHPFVSPVFYSTGRAPPCC